MLKSRLEAQELARQHNVQPWPKAVSATAAAADGAAGSAQGGEEDVLPDPVVVAMLRRESLLTKAKLHYLLFEHLQADRQLRSLRAQLKQVRVALLDGIRWLMGGALCAGACALQLP